MKLVTFQAENNTERIGALANGDKVIVALQVGAMAKDSVESPYFTSMLAFLEGDRRQGKRRRRLQNMWQPKNHPTPRFH